MIIFMKLEKNYKNITFVAVYCEPFVLQPKSFTVGYNLQKNNFGPGTFHWNVSKYTLGTFHCNVMNEIRQTSSVLRHHLELS